MLSPPTLAKTDPTALPSNRCPGNCCLESKECSKSYRGSPSIPWCADGSDKRTRLPPLSSSTCLRHHVCDRSCRIGYLRFQNSDQACDPAANTPGEEIRVPSGHPERYPLLLKGSAGSPGQTAPGKPCSTRLVRGA